MLHTPPKELRTQFEILNMEHDDDGKLDIPTDVILP